MKKKTNVQIEPEDKPKRGPQKEKTQVTLRLDSDLMNEAYKQMKEDNTRITDIVERGLYLALRERDHDLPFVAKQVRFMVANATRDQQVLLKGLLVAMIEPLLDRKVFTPAASDEKLYELIKWFLAERSKAAHVQVALDYYSRYGKSPEEIAKLGKL